MSRRALSLFVLSFLTATSGFTGSLRFHGTGTGDLDRVKIAIDAPARPADVGGDFTLEWWMKANTIDNNTAPCSGAEIGANNWRNGNVLFDRDISATPDFGEYGVAIFNGRIAFGVSTAAAGNTLCGAINTADDTWHHVAVTRRASDGQLAIFVDGTPDRTGAGPAGDISYNDGRSGEINDPYLVIGAEKFDLGNRAYDGFIDEVRLSSTIRYTTTFARPRQPYFKDASTVLLLHFDERSGNAIHDESGAAGGPSNGERQAGTDWSPESAPFVIANNLAIVPVVASGLSSALGIVHAGDGTGRIFVVQQTGQIRIVNSAGTLLGTPFLDIQSKISCCGERGLLGLAFDPNYSTNGFFYVYYTRAVDFFITIARYRVSANPNVADPNSEVILKAFDHGPFSNHNGGQLAFGPDGYLYAGVGDGGSAGDPADNAQNIDVLLGKILRLDVNAPPSYIPASNPFVGVAGADEIWAYGVRNPWRFCFDRLTGDLYIADVGQGTREEVDFQLAGVSGGQNYGWDVLEGTFCYPDNPPNPPDACTAFLTGGSVLPIIEYPHSAGRCSITGGYVFRGRPNSFIANDYFYGDYCTAEIWRATPNGSGGWGPPQFVSDAGSGLTSFGEDEAKNLYFTTGPSLQRITPYTFMDVPPANAAWLQVESIVAAGITTGCTATTYCPNSNVTRAQMAIFLLRAKHGQTYLPPPATGTVFTDVPASSSGAAWIEQLYAEGITGGCGGGKFCPNDPVRRDQMAVFLLRAHDGSSYTPPPCTGIFTDVPCSSFFAPWIEELSRRGITTGCAPTTYCPAGTVTRGSMATFVSRTFSLP